MKRLILFAFTVVLALSMTACITINVTTQDDSSSQPQQSQQPADSDEILTPEIPSDNPQQPAGIPDTPVSPQVPDTPEDRVTDYALYEEWAKFVGWWQAAEGRFALPDMMDSHTAYFAHGIWDTGYGPEGSVTYMYKSGDYEITAYVDFNGTEEMIVVDYSGLDQDGKIRINTVSEWRHYMFAGNTKDEAYNTYLENMAG